MTSRVDACSIGAPLRAYHPSSMSASGPADDAAVIMTPRLELRPLTLQLITALLESQPRSSIEGIDWPGHVHVSTNVDRGVNKCG